MHFNRKVNTLETLIKVSIRLDDRLYINLGETV